MLDTIKNDPLIRTILVIILGILGFGFAFNIMFGANNSGVEHGTAGVYSLDFTLTYILVELVKILLITAIILAIIAVFKYLSKYFASNSGSSIIDNIKSDPLLKTITIVLLIILVFSLIYLMIGSTVGYGRGYQMSYNNSVMVNIGYGFSWTSILVLLVRMLLIISVVGLVIGLAVLFIQVGLKDNKDIISFFKVKKTEGIICIVCGTNVKQDWRCCPKCGTDIGVENNSADANTDDKK